MARRIEGAPVCIVNADAIPVTVVSTDRLDTDGNAVPTYKSHAFTYDNSGNLATDTVTDGTNTWVRTYTYTPSGPETDSGWVKQ